jgi:hypothetical protein
MDLWFESARDTEHIERSWLAFFHRDEEKVGVVSASRYQAPSTTQSATTYK